MHFDLLSAEHIAFNLNNCFLICLATFFRVILEWNSILNTFQLETGSRNQAKQNKTEEKNETKQSKKKLN